ncbi:hypothetical protein EJB05_43196, partial [Eragrostis curvula]
AIRILFKFVDSVPVRSTSHFVGRATKIVNSVAVTFLFSFVATVRFGSKCPSSFSVPPFDNLNLIPPITKRGRHCNDDDLLPQTTRRPVDLLIWHLHLCASGEVAVDLSGFLPPDLDGPLSFEAQVLHRFLMAHRSLDDAGHDGRFATTVFAKQRSFDFKSTGPCASGSIT